MENAKPGRVMIGPGLGLGLGILVIVWHKPRAYSQSIDSKLRWLNAGFLKKYIGTYMAYIGIYMGLIMYILTTLELPTHYFNFHLYIWQFDTLRLCLHLFVNFLRFCNYFGESLKYNKKK